MSSPFEKPISRRKALAGAGSVGLGALLAACGADDGGGTTTEVATTEGSTTTVQPKSGNDLTALFGEDSACTLTDRADRGPLLLRRELDPHRHHRGPRRRAASPRRAGSGVRLLRAASRTRSSTSGTATPAASTPASSRSRPAPAASPTTGSQRFLRGAQVTDADGIVQFKTIFPGWYQGRTVHIHAKVHVDNSTVLTTQVYFDEAITDSVMALEPYSSRGEQETRNADDFGFDESLTVALEPEGEGYVGAISFDVA